MVCCVFWEIQMVFIALQQVVKSHWKYSDLFFMLFSYVDLSFQWKFTGFSMKIHWIFTAKLASSVCNELEWLKSFTIYFVKPGVRPVSWNCFTKSVCVYACIFVCLSAPTWVSMSKPFTWNLKAACKQTIKAKQSLYYTHAQASSPLKV